MSLQWTIVAGILYLEVATVVLLLLPIISPAKWNALFKSKFLRSITNMSQFYFRAVLAILCLLLIDAFREQQKYYGEVNTAKTEHGVHLDADMQSHMRLFRAQRNIYISGFSLLLWVVINRISTLLCTIAVANAERDAALKQAKSASAAASTFMKSDAKDTRDKSETEKVRQTDDSRLVESLEKENCRLNAEYKSALKQAESVGDEYDRLLKEHEQLQKKLAQATGDAQDKKSD